MNKSRFFAFGCSYTNWTHPTWADFVGINFKEYYNFGKPGACNTYITNKLMEADELHTLNAETDFVMVALTGFGRFTYLETYDNRHTSWETHGDILFGNDGHPDTVKLIRKSVFNFPWAAYNSWMAFKTIKKILLSSDIEHKIIMSIDNSHYIDNAEILGLYYEFDNIGKIVPKIKNIYDSLDVKETIDEYRLSNRTTLYPYDTNGVHPSKQIYYDYCLKHFPELITNKSIDLLDTPNEIWKSKFKK